MSSSSSETAKSYTPPKGQATKSRAEATRVEVGMSRRRWMIQWGIVLVIACVIMLLVFVYGSGTGGNGSGGIGHGL